MQEQRTETKVRIFDDHRDNLTVDVNDERVRARAADLRSEHSEAALLWNVFRTLERLDQRVWLPRLVRAALPEADRAGLLRPLLTREHVRDARFHWWKRWDLPPARHTVLRDEALCGTLRLEHYAPHSIPEKRSEVQRRLAAGLPFEDPVEIPLCIETDAWILGIEAVFRSNLRRHTAFDAHRDGVIRLLDAGTHAAGAGRPFLSMVVCTDTRTFNVETARLVERYRGRPERVAEALAYREDRAVVERAAHLLGSVRWKDLGHALLAAKDEERLGTFDVAALDELVKYLARKDVGFSFFRRLK